MEPIGKAVPQTASELRRRLLWLLPELDLNAVGFPYLDQALAMYMPELKQVRYVTDATDEEWSAGVIHELGHVCLHPPGSGRYDNTHAPDGPEEHVVHDAADHVWRAFGLSGYEQLMRARGVPARLLVPAPGAHLEIVSDVAAWVEAAIRTPAEPPAYPAITAP